MIKPPAEPEGLGWLSFPVSNERLPKFCGTARDVTVMNLLPDKEAPLILTGEKTGKGLRSPSFHHSAPNLSEMTEEEATIREKVVKAAVPSPKALYATEAQRMENLLLNRPLKLSPLESGLEGREAQLQKITSFKRDAQPVASKLASVGSVCSELHVERVKNLSRAEVGNLHQIKMAEKATVEHQGRNWSSRVSEPACELILPTQGDPKPPKKPTANDYPIPCHKPVISQNFQSPDFQESAKIVGRCSQGNGRDGFRLKQTKERERFGQNKPLKTTGYGMEEGEQKMVGQRAHKTLSDASKLLEHVAKKYKGRRDESDETDQDLLMRIQSLRRMALGDITQVDED